MEAIPIYPRDLKTTEESTSLLVLPKSRGRARERNLVQFAAEILKLNKQASQKMSSRGWCYFLEGFNLISKADFNKAQDAINECRKKGFLPINFVAEDPKRSWNGVETPETDTPETYLKRYLTEALRAEEYYTPDWWQGERYFCMMMVEKIDLVNMFGPICAEYHIPIVNAGGWYDISERAGAARHFKRAERKGLTPVLLYFGDLDPWGQCISDTLKQSFYEISRGSRWVPSNLLVDRFGLNQDFIERQSLTWIENLESSSGKDMSKMNNRIVKEYIAKIGFRKCEANAVMKVSARAATLGLCREIIEKYLGNDALSRFAMKREEIRQRLREFKERTGLVKAISDALSKEESG